MKAETDCVTLGMIGLGYWGPNLLRNFARIPTCRVKVCCDLDADRLAQAKSLYSAERAVSTSASESGVDVTKDPEDLLNDPTLQALVIATPAVTHFDLVKRAILAGKHVFVEKPMALSAKPAWYLVDLVKQAGVKLMVGHLMEYHPAVLFLKGMISRQELGDIYYLYSQRLNLGRIREDENTLWSLGPHDISMMIFLLGCLPESVSARGHAYLQKGIEDVVFLNLTFPGDVMAQIQLSWLDPQKVRRITIVGSKQMAIFDDMVPGEMVRIYDKGVDSASPYDGTLCLRFGDVRIPYIQMVEPLKLECEHFIDCILQGKQPRSDALDGLRVIRILEAAQKSLDSGGTLMHLGG